MGSQLAGQLDKMLVDEWVLRLAEMKAPRLAEHLVGM